MLASQETTDMAITHLLLDIFITFVLSNDDGSKEDASAALTEETSIKESTGRNLSLDLLEELRLLLSSLMQRADDLKQKGTSRGRETPP